jgi:aspartyl-tRNA(Asn)/glutamyl-tRNA(Gln) amidotransferase subunit A
VKGLRIGVPKEFFGAGLSPDVEQPSVRRSTLPRNSAPTIREVSLPNAALVGIPSITSSRRPSVQQPERFDGVRYGYRTPEYGDLTDMIERRAPRASAPRSSAAS